MATTRDTDKPALTILTDEQVGDLYQDWNCFFKDNPGSAALCIRAIEQAVLQSAEVQAWKRDAERQDWLERHFTVVDGAYVDGNREAKIFHVDCEDDSFTEYKRNRIRDAVSAAMEKQP